jgi:hypothetical protein
LSPNTRVVGRRMIVVDHKNRSAPYRELIAIGGNKYTGRDLRKLRAERGVGPVRWIKRETK